MVRREFVRKHGPNAEHYIPLFFFTVCDLYGRKVSSEWIFTFKGMDRMLTRIGYHDTKTVQKKVYKLFKKIGFVK